MFWWKVNFSMKWLYVEMEFNTVMHFESIHTDESNNTTANAKVANSYKSSV